MHDYLITNETQFIVISTIYVLWALQNKHLFIVYKKHMRTSQDEKDIGKSFDKNDM